MVCEKNNITLVKAVNLMVLLSNLKNP